MVKASNEAFITESESKGAYKEHGQKWETRKTKGSRQESPAELEQINDKKKIYINE